MPDLPEEAVEAAAARKYMQMHPRDFHRWSELHPDFKGRVREKTKPLVEAAAPTIRKQRDEELRERTRRIGHFQDDLGREVILWDDAIAVFEEADGGS